MGVPLAAADRRELEIVGLLRYVFAFKSMSVCVFVCWGVHVYVRVNDFVCVSACNCVSMHVCLCAM